MANIIEGRINNVKVMFLDDEGNEKKRGNATPHNFVRRELSFLVSPFGSRDNDALKLDLIYEAHCPVPVQ